MTPGSAYSEVIKVMDRRLGQFFDMIETNAQLAGHTAIILGQDHATLDHVFQLAHIARPGVIP